MNTITVFRNLFCLSLLASMALCSCSQNSPTGISPAEQYRRDIKVGYTVPAYIVDRNQSYADSLPSYILSATVLSGKNPDDTFTMTGTLTLDSAGTAINYSPIPNNCLRVIGPDGSATDFVVNSFTSGSDVCGDRDVDFTVTPATGDVIRITGTRTGYHIRRTLRGTVNYNGVKYTTDLTDEGMQVCGERSRHTKVTGSISATDVSITVNEEHIDTLNSASKILHRTRRISNQWISGENKFKLSSAEIHTGFMDGRPHNCAKNWFASGELMCNGFASGELGYALQGTGITIWADSPAGRAVLEQWNF